MNLHQDKGLDYFVLASLRIKVLLPTPFLSTLDVIGEGNLAFPFVQHRKLSTPIDLCLPFTAFDCLSLQRTLKRNWTKHTFKIMPQWFFFRANGSKGHDIHSSFLEMIQEWLKKVDNHTQNCWPQLLFNLIWGSTVAQLMEPMLMEPQHQWPSFTLNLCAEFAHSASDSVGFPCLLQFSPTFPRWGLASVNVPSLRVRGGILEGLLRMC